MIDPRRLLRLEYHWQPAQLLRRAWREATGVRRRPRALIRLPWGFPIIINPRESIGRAIVALNVLDLSVTETIWRLLDEGENAADIGANIGYMTSVMAARTRRGGRVLAFEPIPEIFAVLEENTTNWKPHTGAAIDIHREAVGDTDGAVDILITDHFTDNQGTGSIIGPVEGTADIRRRIPVSCRRFDSIAGDSLRFGLVKVDVEGAEALVFRGARALLSTGRIRDIVFEEHRTAPAESHQILRSHGYSVFRVARRRAGPALRPIDAPVPSRLDPPTYLATLDPSRAADRFSSRGWRCLRT